MIGPLREILPREPEDAPLVGKGEVVPFAIVLKVCHPRMPAAAVALAPNAHVGPCEINPSVGIPRRWVLPYRSWQSSSFEDSKPKFLETRGSDHVVADTLFEQSSHLGAARPSAARNLTEDCLDLFERHQFPRERVV
jgi:hypothetical protein